MHLAFSEYSPLDPRTTLAMQPLPGTTASVDVRDLDTRVLLSVTNLTHLSRTIVPSLVKQFSDAYACPMMRTWSRSPRCLPSWTGILFSDYIKRKSMHVSGVLTHGILHAGVDWARIPKPTAVHAFIYEALLTLVQVTRTSGPLRKPLVTRTITTLVDSLATTTLTAFSERRAVRNGWDAAGDVGDRVSPPDAKRVYQPRSGGTLKDVYETISQRYTRKGEGEKDELGRELERVKQVLLQSRKSTALEFLCFRRAKRDKEDGGAT